MLLAVRHRLRIRQLREHDSRMRHLGRHRLMPEVEAQTIAARLAHHARQQRGGHEEIHVWHLRAITGIPEHARAGAALHITAFRVNRKRRRPTRDNRGNRQSRCDQISLQLLDRSKGSFTVRGSRRQILIVNVSVIGVQSAGAQARHRSHATIELNRRRPGLDAAPMLPAIDIEQDGEPCSIGNKRLRQLPRRRFVIHQRCELGLRILPRELHHARDVRPHRLIREQHIRRATRRRHLRLRDGRALELRDAQLELKPDHLRHLVRLHVRPQPRHAARDGNHAPDIFLHALRINEQ